MNCELKVAYMNVRGLSPNKLLLLSSFISSPNSSLSSSPSSLSSTEPNCNVDILCIAESWYMQHSTLINHPLCVAHSPYPDSPKAMGHQLAGLLVLASPSIRANMSPPVCKQYAISFSVHQNGACFSLSFLYLPPSLPINKVADILESLPRPDILMGDFNTYFEPSPRPADRVALLNGTTEELHMTRLPLSSGASRVDHSYVSSRILPGSSLRAVHQRDVNIDSDHPLLLLVAKIPGSRTQESSLGSPCPKRFYSRYLRNKTSRDVFIHLYEDISAKSLSIQLDLSHQAHSQLAKMPMRARQELVDLVDMVIMTLIHQACEMFLGSYQVEQVQQCKDKTMSALRTKEHLSPLEATILFKRSHRASRNENLLASRDPSKSPLEDAQMFFADIFAPPHLLHSETESNNNLDLAVEVMEMHLFSWTSVSDAIWSYPSGKSPGVDSVDISIIKALMGRRYRSSILQSTPSALLKQLTFLFKLCLYGGVTPRRWNEAIVYPLPKPGSPNPEHIDQRRPISLTVLMRRIFERILLKHIAVLQENNVIPPFSPTQAGFRSGFSSASLALLSDACSRRDIQHKAFLDLRQAYDTVPLHRLWTKLQAMRCPTYVLLLLQGLLHNCCCRIVVNGRLSMPIARKRGLLQGSVLSPWLFNIFIDDLARTIEQECCYGNAPAGLFFADDIQLQGTNAESVQHALDITQEWVSANEMAVNISKSGHFAHQDANLKVGLEELPVVSQYKYLGFPHAVTGVDWTSHLWNNLRKAENMLIALKKKFPSNLYQEAVKLQLYKAFSRSMLDYGAAMAFPYLVDGNDLPMRGISPLTEQIKKKMTELQEEAMRWIFNASLPPAVALSLTALGSLERRCQELACRFSRHLSFSHQNNPVRLTMRFFHPLSTPLTRSINNQSLLRRFHQAKDMDPTVNLKSFMVDDRLKEIEARSTLAAVISRDARAPSGMDRTLSILDPVIRKDAIRHRRNVLGYGLHCRSCQKPYRRLHPVTCFPGLQGGNTASEILDNLLNDRQYSQFYRTKEFIFRFLTKRPP